MLQGGKGTSQTFFKTFIFSRRYAIFTEISKKLLYREDKENPPILLCKINKNLKSRGKLPVFVLFVGFSKKKNHILSCNPLSK